MGIILPNEKHNKLYCADTFLPLVDANRCKKVRFNALARHAYPGNRLTDDTLGLNSIGYWDAKEEQDWGLDWHRNEGVGIHYLESGEMPYSCEGKNILLKPGYLTITKPWQIHKVGDPIIRMGKFFWVIFDVNVRKPHQKWKWPDWIILSKKDIDLLTSTLQYNEQPYWKADKKTRNCFMRLHHAIDSDIKGSNASIIKVLINELFLSLLNLLSKGNVKMDGSLTDSMGSVQYFVKELAFNYTRKWTVEGMAKEAGLGTTQFITNFKCITNVTPIQFINQKRIDLAKEMLKKQNNYSITEIAYECGYSSSQYFARVFKRITNQTPLYYRKSQTQL